MKQITITIPLTLATLCVPANAWPALVGAQHCYALFLFPGSSSTPAATSGEKPDWCKPLPRPEYKSLQRVLPNESWFEVYKVSPASSPFTNRTNRKKPFRI